MKTSHLAALSVACALAVATVAAAAGAPLRPATDVCGAIAAGARWTAAGSPYVTTCEVVVPAGVQLAIDPGTVVRLGEAHRIVVNGSLQAVGSAEAPLRFEAVDPAQPWGSIYLAPGSGPSEIAFAQLTGGGAARKEMLGIESDQAVVRDSSFGENYGVAVEVKNGASPTIERCSFVKANDPAASPAAALRLRGQSDAVVTDNSFQSNDYAVFWDADANPRFERNRFAFNGHDGVFVAGRITREVSLRTLGPRNWSYTVLSPGIVVEQTGELSIGPGTTMRFHPGNGIRVAGTLAIRGQAANEVLITTGSLTAAPGQWNDIEFGAGSIDYVPETGDGCVIEHTIMEYGGGRQTGVLNIRASSPRIANNVIRHSGQRGITVTGVEGRPEIVGNTFDANTNDPEGVAVFVTGGAVPSIRFNVFRNNTFGVRAERAAQPRIEPHNWFDRNLQYAVYNDDRETCVEATQNDWGAPGGPNDSSDLPGDACGMGSNASEDGDLISDHVRYVPWEGQVARPVLEGPSCGSTSDRTPAIWGLAPAGAKVHVFDNQVVIGTAQAADGPEAMTAFRFEPAEMAPGSHVLQLQAELGGEYSGLTEPLSLFVDPEQAIDPGSLTVSYDLDGTHFVQPYRSASGCASLGSGDWRMRLHPVDAATLSAAIACPGGATPQAALVYGASEHPLVPSGDGAFQVTFAPGEGGPAALRLACGGATTQVSLGTIEREYNGIVYDEAIGPAFGRINAAEVTLFQWDAGLGDWRVWPASDYYGQTNPIVTGPGGWLIYYPPPGLYYAQAVAKGFETGETSEVTIVAEPFVANLPLRRQMGDVILPYLARGHVR